MLLNKKKTYIIAEAGVNHQGKFHLAKKLINIAKKCGADAIKFQSFIPEEVVVKNLSLASYQKKNLKKKYITMLDMINKYKLSFSNQIRLCKHAKKKKIDFISSAFDLTSLDFLINNLKLKIIKIPSGEITNYPYLKKISKNKIRLIMSTGMSNIKEISQALNCLISDKLKKRNIILMHCNTAYPTPYQDVNLNVMNKLKKIFKTEIGYSDHSLGIEVPLAAVALGAKVIEKHITLNKHWEGPDHKASLMPNEFKKMTTSIRNLESAMGKSKKKITKSEKKNLYFARKSIVASKNIIKGEKFNSNNLTTKRPAGGISPMLWNRLINKKSKLNYYKDEKIK